MISSENATNENVAKLHEFINSNLIVGGSNPEVYRARHWLHALSAELDEAERKLHIRSTKTNCCGCSDDICKLDHGRAKLAEEALEELREVLQALTDACTLVLDVKPGPARPDGRHDVDIKDGLYAMSAAIGPARVALARVAVST